MDDVTPMPPALPTRRRLRSKRGGPRAPALASGLVALAGLLAACGSSSPSASVARLGSQTASTSASAAAVAQAGSGAALNGGKLIAFSACMRSHGVPSFPDPTVSGDRTSLHVRVGPGSAIDPNSPQFQAAQKVCAPLRPQPSPAQAAQLQATALKFSACMRSHGEPSFPDPTFSGDTARLTIQAGSGVDPNSPQFQAAQRACQAFVPDKQDGP